MLKLLPLLLLLSLYMPLAHAIIIDDKDWRQVTDTYGMSESDVLSVCSSSTGQCTGSVSGINVDGYTWASLDEVTPMFTFLDIFQGRQRITSSAQTDYFESSAGDAELFLDIDGNGSDTGLFSATHIDPGEGYARINGVTRDGGRTEVYDFFGALEGVPESLRVHTLISSGTYSGSGLWLYKPVVQDITEDVIVTDVGEQTVIDNTGNGGLAIQLVDPNGTDDGGKFTATYAEVDVANADLSEYGASDINFAVPGSSLQLWDLAYEGVLEPGELMELVFSFDPTGLSVADMLGLDIYHFTNGAWQGMDATVNTELFTLTAFTDSFSPFVVGQRLIPEPTPIMLFTIWFACFMFMRKKREENTG